MDYTDTEQEVNEALKRYTELQCSGAKDDKVELVATEFVLKLLKKRLFSLPSRVSINSTAARKDR
ncbi:MAG: hypothetical protein ACTS2F_22680 [Thainema sp.]